MKFYFIAGENSGDYMGAGIIKAIGEVAHGESIFFDGVGGPLMKEAGLNSIFDFQQINLMGFIEILPQIFRLKRLIKSTAEDIIRKSPDVLITIDSPGFTFRVAKRVRAMSPKIKLLHIVAPSVWAYRESRAKKYAIVYDKLLTLLPFEPPYFTKYGLSAECIGHPALEQNFYLKSAQLRKEFGPENGEKIIAVTPGSRQGEIARHMPVIREALDRLSSRCPLNVIFIQPNEQYVEYISEFLIGAKFNFRFSTDRLKSFAVSDLALAKSGTNTLEIAASGIPMIVGYKLNPVTYLILKIFLKIRYASIINIMRDREIIPEYIQSDFTAENIACALEKLIKEPAEAAAQVQGTRGVLKEMGLGSSSLVPSRKAAEIILALGSRG